MSNNENSKHENQQHIETLISGYLDESLSNEQFAELESWINADSKNASLFAERVFLDERIRAELNLKRMAEPNLEIKVEPKPARSAPFPSNAMSGAAALAASVLLAFTVWLLFSGNKNNIENVADVHDFVTVTQLVNVARVDGEKVSEGDRISSGLFELVEGIAHLSFDNGVGVTLEGPVQFELTSVDVTRLRSGVLTATVPPGAEGFRVDTPLAQVIDLGTAFGIEQNPDGTSNVSVFDGEVEIVSDNVSGKHLLTEGNSVQLAVDGTVSEVEFAADRFEKLWPAASGIAGSTGAFKFAPQWPRMLRRINSDTDIIVLPEGYAMELEEPCLVDMTMSGSNESSIAAGQRIRSFLLQFNPEDPVEREPNRNGQLKRIEGSITFDRPILGLIIEGDTLQQTDALFSFRAGPGPQMRRGLESNPPRVADEVSVTDDGHTLTLKLVAFDRLSDHVRVIVDASLPELATE
ncbi:MAG: FecR family protein [Planctomycetota bacterium]